MGGFGYDLKRKILGNNAHVVVDVTRPAEFGDWEPGVSRSCAAMLAKTGRRIRHAGRRRLA
jgi:lipoprotein-releasing system permease protein